MLPFLRPGNCCLCRDNTAAPKEVPHFYVNGASNYRCDPMKALLPPARIIHISDITPECPFS